MHNSTIIYFSRFFIIQYKDTALYNEKQTISFEPEVRSVNCFTTIQSKGCTLLCSPSIVITYDYLLTSYKEFHTVDDVDAFGEVFHFIAVGGVEHEDTLCVVYGKLGSVVAEYFVNSGNAKVVCGANIV